MVHQLRHRLEGTFAVPALACALAIAAMLSYATALAAHDHGGHGHGGPLAAHATWVERPASLDDATKTSLFVVEASVSAIRAGTAISSVEDVGGGVTETDTTPTQLIDFTTRSVVKGPAPSSFTMHKTGSSSWYIDGDPPYRVGERYLLFLERFVDDTGAVSAYINLAPDGRFLVDANNLLHTFIDGALAIELDGQPLDAAKQKVTISMQKQSMMTTSAMFAPTALDVVAGPTETVEDAVGDADDQVSGTESTGIETVEGVAPVTSPVTDDVPCPAQLPIYCPAP